VGLRGGTGRPPWVRDGVPSHRREFFIAVDEAAEDIWHRRFAMELTMLRIFISPSLARRILLAGASLLLVWAVVELIAG
jgi:hypothetical protein